MMLLSRKFLLVVALFIGSLFARSPSTAHFCVSNFDYLKYEGFFSLDIRAVQNVVPDTEWNWPDSLMCGRSAWINKLVLNYKGAQIELSGNYDATSKIFSCSLCADPDRMRKRAVSSPSIGKVRVFQNRDDDEIFKHVDSTFIRELYGKKIRAEWESNLLCLCPHYSPALFKTELDVVIDGPCSSSMDSTTWELKRDESDMRCVAGGGASGQAQKDSVLADGMMPCFMGYLLTKWTEPRYYVSSKRMNMVDKPEGLDDNLECFDVAGERLLVFASNVPDQTYNEAKDDSYAHCYASLSDFEKKKSWDKPYYSCFRGESAPGGCKAEFGLDFVIDANGNYIGWDRKALWLYLEMKEASDIRKFYEALGNNILVKETLLPANFPESKVQEVGDDAARKTAGMAFYKGKKRVRYKRFKQNQLKSMQDAIDMCKAWKF